MEAIARVEAWIVAIPRDTPYLGAAGPHDIRRGDYLVRAGNRTVYPVMDRSILVKLTTSSGATGWGETYGLVAPRATCEILRDLLVPFALGEDPRSPAALHERLRDLMRVRNSVGGLMGDALAALDIACWDAAARLAGLPLSHMLGASRRTLPAYLSGLPKPTLAERIEFAAEWAARGFDAFKFAAAISEDGEPAELAGLRERLGPEARIAVDLHWRYTAPEALALIGRMAPHGLFFAEAPVAPEDIAGLARVAAASHVPIAAGEEWFSVHDAVPRIGGLAIVQPEIAHCGVTEFVRIARLAEAHHARLMPHATIGTGIFLAASLHAAASCANFALHEYQHSVFDRNVALLETSMRIEGTSYVLPDGPGIGAIPSEQLWRHAEPVFTETA
jgi:L-alanine-DL-glutamate epimerase-like enolase superfamily enzyme